MSEDFERLKKILIRHKKITEASWKVLQAASTEDAVLHMLSLILQLFEDRLADLEKRVSALEKTAVRYVVKESGRTRKKQKQVPNSVRYV